MARVINTVAAYRSLLTEEDADLKEIGVRKLLSHITLHWIDIANDINLMYSSPHPARNSTRTPPSPTNPLSPSCWPNSTSTSMTTMRPLTSPSKPPDSSMSNQPKMSSHKSSSTSASRDTSTAAGPKSRTKPMTSTKKWLSM